jgi:hypothetical protein
MNNNNTLKPTELRTIIVVNYLDKKEIHIFQLFPNNNNIKIETIISDERFEEKIYQNSRINSIYSIIQKEKIKIIETYTDLKDTLAILCKKNEEYRFEILSKVSYFHAYHSYFNKGQIHIYKHLILFNNKLIDLFIIKSLISNEYYIIQPVLNRVIEITLTNGYISRIITREVMPLFEMFHLCQLNDIIQLLRNLEERFLCEIFCEEYQFSEIYKIGELIKSKYFYNDYSIMKSFEKLFTDINSIHIDNSNIKSNASCYYSNNNNNFNEKNNFKKRLLSPMKTSRSSIDSIRMSKSNLLTPRENIFSPIKTHRSFLIHSFDQSEVNSSIQMNEDKKNNSIGLNIINDNEIQQRLILYDKLKIYSSVLNFSLNTNQHILMRQKNNNTTQKKYVGYSIYMICLILSSIDYKSLENYRFSIEFIKFCKNFDDIDIDIHKQLLMSYLFDNEFFKITVIQCKKMIKIDEYPQQVKESIQLIWKNTDI